MEKFLKVEVQIQSPMQAELLVAVLSEIDFYAFEENHNFLNAYIKESDFDKGKFEEVMPGGVKYELSVIDDQNWNAEWEKGFHPVVVNSFVGIRALFHASIGGVKHEIIITPKMSFGTGHHATTYLMIDQMQHINFTGKCVIDFGTGTGVLAILAEKLGAKKIVAIDKDTWAIENAIENIKVNKCQRIEVLQAESVSSLTKPDIILANITQDVITASTLELSSVCTAGALILLSGFFTENRQTIIDVSHNAASWKLQLLHVRIGYQYY